ncbi:MAG: hypothetical protein JWN02_2814, partial [Acidobacteria bacterium]|nr:hypothetical protein [Acidobacteriota bacterium]
PQLWSRLQRFARIHRLAAAAGRSDRALRDFIRSAERECRLTLMRSLVGIGDIIRKIEEGIRTVPGLSDPLRFGHFAPEAKRIIDALPLLERSIVFHLIHDGQTHWARPGTVSDINSLVGLPIGTVVVTVKPPGSSHELEIKRSGRARELPLDVVWARNQYILPSSHHLDGGAMHQLLTFEAANSAFFSRVFREVHGFDAHMSRTLSLATVSTLPTPTGVVEVRDYFNDRGVFGHHYEEMRWNMRLVVKTLAEHDKQTFDPYIGEGELTEDFLRRIQPAQAIQIGTSAFRLDRLADHLQPDGAQHYLCDALGRPFDAGEARRFADEILDEVLGHYEPPAVTWRSHSQYLDAAFRVPANRARAARNYLDTMAQAGRFWGTLLGIRGHTEGESFVARNTGLRTVWEEGRWQVRMIFMDHDSMAFASVDTDVYRPLPSLRDAAKDGKHIFGGAYATYKVRGSLSYLAEIYRAGPSLKRRGGAAFRAATKQAYDRTHRALRRNAGLSQFFREPFLDRLRDWDELVASYLRTPSTRSARTTWRRASRERLLRRGYDGEVADEHLETIRRHAIFLRRIAFLF